MSNPDRNTAALCETYLGHKALGNRVIEGSGCVAIRNDRAPRVYDANLLWIGPDARLDTSVAFLETHFSDRPYRRIHTDPSTPPEFPAQLTLEGYVSDPTLQLLLTGELNGPAPKPFDIRPVEGDDDWQRLGLLFRADHVETDQKRGTQVFSASLTDQIVETHRKAAEEVNFFQAWVDDQAVAFFSSWPGRNGVGMVEDLFTLSAHRHQGIARALIHHCVADARAHGAQQVLIGAEVDDTPKTFYAALGFRPTCLTHSWLKTL